MSTSTDLDSATTVRVASVQVPKFSGSRQDANPILAIHMLQEMYKMVAKWQQELQEIDRQRSEIATNGPILAAWLESRTFKANEAGKAIPTPYTEIAAIGLTEVDPLAGYRLCGLDEYGELWTRPCASEEILSVSQAIARYQQSKDLTARQHQIELHIRQILEDLVHLRMKIAD